MPFIGLLIAFLAVPIAAWGADSTKPETPTLTVAGTGSLTVAPDTAFVTVGMETAGKSLAQAQRQNSTVMQKVMERLRALKIDKERIQTSSFTVTPQYRPSPKHPAEPPPSLPEIIGYRISNTVTVEVRDLEKVAAAVAAGAAAKQSGQLTLQVAHHGVEVRRTLVLVGAPWITFIAVVPSHRASHFLSNTIR